MKIEDIQKEDVCRILPTRPSDAHKNLCGRVLVIAGAEGMAGAGIMCAEAAMKSGSGIVKLCCCESGRLAVNIRRPEIMTPVLEDALNELSHFDSVCIGPGLGRGEKTKEITKTILRNFEKTVIIDADGLNALSDDIELQEIVQQRAGVIITPHRGEASRLLGGNFSGREPAEKLLEALNEKYGTVTVIKGPGSLIGDGHRIYRNTSGNPGMATAGSGDVLTGIIGALVAGGCSPFEATWAAVWIHGAAGDLAAEDKGEDGLTAGDIIENIPYVFKDARNGLIVKTRRI